MGDLEHGVGLWMHERGLRVVKVHGSHAALLAKMSNAALEVGDMEGQHRHGIQDGLEFVLVKVNEHGHDVVIGTGIVEGLEVLRQVVVVQEGR